MLIGIDFDNTIIGYDAVFHAVALERELIPSTLPKRKQAVRDHLREAGREDEWTLMQGFVYGCRIDDAQPMAGVIDAMVTLQALGHELAIVSHKTRHPYAGPKYDLHTAARNWLAKQRIAGDASCVLCDEQVFLEPTSQAKLNRIAALGCAHFVDDLPEFLCEPNFPSITQRWLFDPADAHANQPQFHKLTHWSDLPKQLAKEAAA